jgi:hypothetical protein
MSQYERESLAAEATLSAEKKLKNGRRPASRKKNSTGPARALRQIDSGSKQA